MKNKYIIILFIVIGIFISSLITIYALNIIQPGKTIEAIAIPIAFLNIFATGYGAYLGAKISGENATKLMKNELIISDLREHKSADMVFLKEFSEIINRQKLYEEISMLNFSNRIVSTIVGLRELKKIITRLESTSQIIRFQTELFFEDFKKCEMSAQILNSRINRCIKKYIEHDLDIDIEKKSVQIYDGSFISLLNLYNLGHKKAKIKVEIHLVPNDKKIIYGESVDVFDHEVNLKSVVDFIIKDNNKEISNFIKQIKNNITILENLKFKNQEELRSYILQYYELK